jgi:DNA-binding PadR family transcriptional regulator
VDPKHTSYSLTEAGARALADASSGLSIPCRRILGFVQGETHFAVISAGMAMCAEAQVAGWLKQLESQGLLKAHGVGAERDLDFTGSLSLAALRAAPKPA